MNMIRSVDGVTSIKNTNTKMTSKAIRIHKTLGLFTVKLCQFTSAGAEAAVKDHLLDFRSSSLPTQDWASLNAQIGLRHKTKANPEVVLYPFSISVLYS